MAIVTLMVNNVSMDPLVIPWHVHAFPLIQTRRSRRSYGPKPKSPTLQPRASDVSVIGPVMDSDRRSHIALDLLANPADSDFSDFGDNFPPNWDLESARTNLEHLMSEQQQHGVNYNDYNQKRNGSTLMSGTAFSEPTIVSSDKLDSRITETLLGGIVEHSLNLSKGLTSIDRVRRTTEIQLLSELETDLHAMEALNHFWVHERGSNAARDLLKADEIFQKGESSWNHAERMLTQLVEEYDPYWVEPLHRLGILYYLQGRCTEARLLEEAVLRHKPWHVGALSNYVRIAESQRDVDTALLWAARRLPPRIGKRRSEWVQRSVQAAIDSLSQMEKHLGMYLGESSLHPVEEEAWQ